MIAALAQTAFHPGQRSRNLTLLLQAVTDAAKLTPAPDLILLPDGADLSLATEKGPLLSPAMCQGLTESIALLAREWGVWIAAGHATLDDGRIAAAVTLFDPDGDPYVRHIHTPEGGRAWTVRLTPIGRVGVGFMGQELLAESEAAGGADELDLLILAPASDGSRFGLDALAMLATRNDCYVCLVEHNLSDRIEAGGETIASVIIGRDGEVIAKTHPHTPAIEMVTLSIEPPSADRLRTWEAAISGE